MARLAVCVLCVTVYVPVQSNCHVTSPDGVPTQHNGSTDGISNINANWPVQHEKSLLPVCRPEEK